MWWCTHTLYSRGGHWEYNRPSIIDVLATIVPGVNTVAIGILMLLFPKMFNISQAIDWLFCINSSIQDDQPVGFKFPDKNKEK